MASSDISLPAPEAVGRQESLAVKSALKATLDRELAEEASATGAERGGPATPQHLASPGRFAATATRAGRSSR